MYLRPFLGDNARSKLITQTVTEPVWRAPAPVPTLIDSSLSPGHQVVLTQAQTVPTQAPSQPATVVVQNPDGTLSVANVMQSNMPHMSPELLSLADEPGGSSGFNLAPGASGQLEPIESENGSGLFYIGAALLALFFLGSR